MQVSFENTKKDLKTFDFFVSGTFRSFGDLEATGPVSRIHVEKSFASKINIKTLERNGFCEVSFFFLNKGSKSI